MDRASIVTLVDILVNIVFWGLVLYISWNKLETPEWAFYLLFLYVVYFSLRFILMKKGMERMVYWYSLNMFVILYLFYIFRRK